MVRRSLFYFFGFLRLLGLCQMVLVKKKSEEIDDERREMWVFVVNSFLSELQS